MADALKAVVFDIGRVLLDCRHLFAKLIDDPANVAAAAARRWQALEAELVARGLLARDEKTPAHRG
jgi:hypothetical protein